MVDENGPECRARPPKLWSVLLGSPARKSAPGSPVRGRLTCHGEARGGEVQDEAQDRPDPVWLGHHRREGVRPRRDHPAWWQGGKAEEAAVQSRLWHIAHHLAR